MQFRIAPGARSASYISSVRVILVPVLLLATLSIESAEAQSAAQKEYTVSIGSLSDRVSSGSIWLYSYSWYALQKIKLGEIKNGRVDLPLDTEKLRRELDPHPNTDGYVVVLQTGEHTWYRTRDILPGDLWSNLPLAVNSLGRATTLPNGSTQLILQSLSKRRITLLYPGGKAAVNARISISIFLWNTNHCAFHEGLPLGTFNTDKTGAIEVLAPLLPLYLDINYYEKVGAGPAGAAYSNNFGLKTGPEKILVLKKRWQLTDDDNLSEDVGLRVLTPAGQPRKGVDVYGNWQTNTCGGHDRIGQTDSKGVAEISVDPSFTGLELMIGGPYSAGDPKADESSRPLTYIEMQQLFSNHKLTIRWGRAKELRN